MKKLFFILSLFLSLFAAGQKTNEEQVLAYTRTLHEAIFGTKDSLVVEGLFGREVTYGHSSGKVENRAEAIRGIVRNRSVYKNLEMDPATIQLQGKIAVTRHKMRANEVTADGTERPLSLMVLMVWKKEKKKWKLMSRQALKI